MGAKRRQLEEQIKNLQAKIKQKQRELTLLCDNEQWYTEEWENVTISKRPKKIEKQLIGRIHWLESFVDQDTGEVIDIQRTMMVSRDGHFVEGY